MAHLAVARAWTGLTLVLTTCAGEAVESASLISSPSSPLLVAPALPTAFPTVTTFPTPLAEPTSPFPVPTEYAALFELAGAVHGWDRLIQRIRIPALDIDSAVVPVGWRVDAKGTVEWDSPGPYVGWAVSSALPDEMGTIVLYGHNNIEGSVFRHLYRLQVDDAIVLLTAQGEWRYRVRETRILAVEEEEAEREAYLSYLGQDASPRVILISCYPPEGNTHRVLITAKPMSGLDDGAKQ